MPIDMCVPQGSRPGARHQDCTQEAQNGPETSNKKTGGPAGSAGVRGEGKGGGGKGGGGGVKVVTDSAGEKGDVKSISIAVAVALLAVFVAKVVAGFVFN